MYNFNGKYWKYNLIETKCNGGNKDINLQNIKKNSALDLFLEKILGVWHNYEDINVKIKLMQLFFFFLNFILILGSRWFEEEKKKMRQYSTDEDIFLK